MNIVYVMSAWSFFCALIGVIYGIASFFTKRSALYLKMITCGVGCQMFARLFNLVYIAVQGEMPEGFHVGMLGIMGSFLFFLSANYGQMDALVDDGSETFRKTRLRALLAPAILLFFYVLFCIGAKDTESRICVGMVAVFLIPCAYYNFKHIIIYDVDMGIIRQVKPYNVLVLGYAYLVFLEYISGYLSVFWLYVLSCTGVGIVTLFIIPVLKKGAGKWTLVT